MKSISRLAHSLRVAIRNISCVFAAGVLVSGELCAGQAGLQRTPTPDFGPNVLVFNPGMPAAQIQQQIDKVYAAQEHSEFGLERNALLFLPGEYHIDIPVGFYTQVVGLGTIPDAVHIDWRSDLQDPVIRDYVSPEKFARLCSRHGIMPDTTCIFYGDA